MAKPANSLFRPYARSSYCRRVWINNEVAGVKDSNKTDQQNVRQSMYCTYRSVLWIAVTETAHYRVVWHRFVAEFSATGSVGARGTASGRAKRVSLYPCTAFRGRDESRSGAVDSGFFMMDQRLYISCLPPLSISVT